MSGLNFQRSLAVVIGIDRYTHGVPELRTAVADARRLGELLESDHGYDTRYLLDEAASLAALTELFTERLPQELGPKDRLLLYYAGHGVAIDGDEGPNGYLLPHDARRGEESTFLHMPLLHDALLELPCRHLLVVFDSCFSGAFRWSGTRAIGGLPKVIHKERFDRFVTDPAWQVISSAAHDQEALDQLSSGSLGSRGDSGSHSPFALALFEALAGAGDVVPAGEGDGVITATELYLYLEDRLQPATIEAGKRQTPRLWPLRKHDKGEFIFLTPGHELNLPPAPPLTFDNNPYLGLSSYDREHAPLFFGRDDAIESLRTHVAEHPFTAVLGASGTGKSSLVKAGLLPRLETDDEMTWKILPVVRPGADAQAALLAALGALTDDQADVAPDIAGALKCTQQWLAAYPGQRLLLIIDQLEELITLATTGDARDVTLGAVATLLEKLGDRLHVVVTLRSDFEPSFADTPVGERWQAGRFIVPAMDLDDYRAIIEGPATQRVLYFESQELIDALIGEVLQTPGALPLLSFTLSEMYIRYIERRSDDRALTWEDYQSLGGVIGALRHRAEEEHERLDAQGRDIMRLIMLRMVAMKHGNISRRRVLLTELEYPDDEQNRRMHAVVERLTTQRLLVGGSEKSGERYVEPAHDALVAAWGRLLDWMRAADDGLANLNFQRRLGADAAVWDGDRASKENRGLLWRDNARAAVLNRLARKKNRATWLNRRELDFAKKSIRRWQILIATTVTGIAFIVGLAAAAGWQMKLAIDREKTASANAAAMTAQNFARDGKLTLSRLLAVEAFRIDASREATDYLFETVQQLPLQAVIEVPADPDQDDGLSPHLQPGDVDYERAATEFLGLSQKDPYTFAHHGATVAIGEYEMLHLMAIVYDLEMLPDGSSVTELVSEEIATLDYPQRDLTALAFSADGEKLAVAATTPQSIQVLVSTDGAEPARSGGDTVVDVLDTDGGVLHGKIPVQVKLVTAVALSDDGTLLAASGEEGLQIVGLDEHDVPPEVLAAGARLSKIAFTANDGELFARSASNKPKRFAIVTREPLGYSAGELPPRYVSFKPDTSQIVSYDNSAIMIDLDGDPFTLWDAATLQSEVLARTTKWPLDLQSTYTVYWDANSFWHHRIDADGAPVKFDIAQALGMTLGQPGPAGHAPQAILGATVPSGELAAVVVWHRPPNARPDDDRQPATAVLVLVNPTQPDWLADHVELPAGTARMLAFSRDGKYLVVAGGDLNGGYARWWRIRGGRLAGEPMYHEFKSQITVMDIGLSDWAAFGARDGHVYLWDLDDNKSQFEEHIAATGRPNALALGTRNRWLAVGRGTAVQLWNTESLQTFGLPLHTGRRIGALAFSDDGAWLAAGTGDESGGLHTWNLDTEPLIDRICAVVGRNLTMRESYTILYREDVEDYHCSCPQWGPPPDLPLAECPD